MSRGKAIPKGCIDPRDGFDDAAERKFFRSCTSLNAVRLNGQRAIKRGEDPSRVSQYVSMCEREIASFVADAIERGDSDFFGRLAARLKAGPSHIAVDPVAHEISGIWSLWQGRDWLQLWLGIDLYEEDWGKGIAARDRSRIPFPVLKARLAETFPGRRFNDESLRKKAKALGVKFPAAGRPKKSRQF